jgi:hypothetical protein
MLAGTGGRVSTPSKLELKALVDLVAVCGGGPADVAMPGHRVCIPAVQRQHPHRSLRCRREWQRRYVQAVYDQATGLDSLHLNRRKGTVSDGRREHIIEPLDGNTRLTAILDFYANVFGIGPDDSGQLVYYSEAPPGQGRPMVDDEREWCDARELPVIWYDNVPPSVAAEVFVGLNRYKSPIRTHEIASALIHGSDNPSLVALRQACSGALPELAKPVLETALVRDTQTFVSFCACAGRWLAGCEGTCVTETPEFVDELSVDAFQSNCLEMHQRVADSMPAIVEALVTLRGTMQTLRLALSATDQGHLAYSRQLKRPSVLVVIYATVALGSTASVITERFASLAGAKPSHPWFDAAKDIKTRLDVAAAAAAIGLEDVRAM